MIILKELIFTGIFLFSRVPIWFIIYLVALKAHVSFTDAIAMLALLTMCKSFVNSEIYNEPMSRYYTSIALKYVAFTILFFIAYIGMFYYVLFATDVVKLIIIGFAFFAVLLFYKTNDDKSGYQSYDTPLSIKIVTTICWLYLLFMPDSAIGHASVVLAIVIIEMYQAYNNKILNYSTNL